MKTLKVREICQVEAPRTEVFVDQPGNSEDMFQEFMVDGLLAYLGVGIVSRFRSSLLATGFLVLSRSVLSPVAL